MKHFFATILFFAVAACAPTNTTPTNVVVQPTAVPTSTQEPTGVSQTATAVLLSDTPTALIVPTEKPTLTNTPEPAKTATFQAIATLWSSGKNKCKVVDSFGGLTDTKGKIAFTSTREGGRIFLMDVDGEHVIPLISACFAHSLSWTPDGKELIFVGGGDEIHSQQIYILNLPQSKITRLTNLPKPAHFQHIILGPVVSPDGRKILFSSNHEGIGALDSALYTIDADGTNLRRLTSGVWYYRNPAWSTDSKKIAFARGRGDGVRDLMIMNANGSELKKFVTCNWPDYPVWSFDGQKIYYTNTCPSVGILAKGVNEALNAGSKVVNGGHQDQDRQYSNLSMSPDGLWLAYSTGRFSFHERNIFVMSIDGKTVKKLTNDGGDVWNDDPAWSPVK